MKKVLYTLFSLIVVSLGLSLGMTGCYYDKEEILYPGTACDTANITYGSTITPILSSFCISCHGGTTASAGINLDSYAAVKIQIDNGRLWGAVSHATNYSPMPKNAAQLNTCNLAKIKKWIDAGAPNN